LVSSLYPTKALQSKHLSWVECWPKGFNYVSHLFLFCRCWFVGGVAFVIAIAVAVCPWPKMHCVGICAAALRLKFWQAPARRGRRRTFRDRNTL